MSCDAFGRWLDDGRPGEGRAAAESHAERCAACARQLLAMDEIEELLSGRFATAPAAFADRVMAELPARRLRPAVPEIDPEPDFPWWVRLVQEPMVAASFLGSAALLAVLPAWFRLAAEWTPPARSWMERGALGLDAVIAAPSVTLLLPGLVVLAAVGAPLLLRAASAAAGDPSPDGDL